MIALHKFRSALKDSRRADHRRTYMRRRQIDLLSPETADDETTDDDDEMMTLTAITPTEDVNVEKCPTSERASIYDVHKNFRLFESLPGPPLCPQNLLCLSANLWYFLTRSVRTSYMEAP